MEMRRVGGRMNRREMPRSLRRMVCHLFASSMASPSLQCHLPSVRSPSSSPSLCCYSPFVPSSRQMRRSSHVASILVGSSDRRVARSRRDISDLSIKRAVKWRMRRRKKQKQCHSIVRSSVHADRPDGGDTYKRDESRRRVDQR